ncbi:MAG: hypothetical protein JSS81_21495 [Acidobacteria bacterium]|nr:hypothetical protein [Acidobacteriota bacterium]
MYCAKCGNPDQVAESYCRKCGVYLPDFEKSLKKTAGPEDHIKVNIVLNGLTAIVSLALAVTLYAVFLPREDTPLVIYLTAGFLTAMFAWQVQVVWRTILLRRHFRKRSRQVPDASDNESKVDPALSYETRRLLNEADPADPANITLDESRTARFGEKIPRK